MDRWPRYFANAVLKNRRPSNRYWRCGAALRKMEGNQLTAAPAVSKTNTAAVPITAGDAGGAYAFPVLIAVARHNPNIAIHHRIAVVLQLNRQRLWGFLLPTTGLGCDLAVPMNRHAIVQHSDPRVGGF